MLNPIRHYSIENPCTVFDEEAMTALELAARTAGKVNEVVKSQNELVEEMTIHRERVDDDLADQNATLEEFEKTTIPAEADKAMKKYINNGTFDRAISEYTNELETRLNNVLENLPEGGTTLDAEVIDIRVDDNGVTHATAGEAIRTRLRSIVDQAKKLVYNNGVFPIPVKWELKTASSGALYYETIPFKIPAEGMSVRVSEALEDELVNGGKLKARVAFGNMVNGKFEEDSSFNEEYNGGSYSDRFTFTPHIPGVYAKIRLNLLKDNSGQLTEEICTDLTPAVPELCKAYTGSVKSGGNVLGFTPCTIINNNPPEEKYSPDWTMRGYTHKYTALSSPLPLEFVNRVSCGAHSWIGAKVYKFDPTTRTTEYVETKHYNGQHPCFGSECSIDFTEYGKNYFAILFMGRVPLWSEYSGAQYADTTKGTKNAERLGLDVSNVVNDVYVDWINSPAIRRTLAPGSPVVQRNLELLRGLKHTTIPARYARGKATASFYLLGQDDFAGVYYGGGYASGTFFYNVSPATYYTALLNPNSVAYGDADPTLDGNHYGIVCSAFTSLLHGYPVPFSTFDMRYNKNVPYFDIEPFNMLTDICKLKQYDLITQGQGETGHTVMVEDVTNVCDMATALHIAESSTPATRENVFFVHNGVNYYRNEPETSFVNAYDYVAITDPAHDATIYDKAEWIPAYTEPRPIMCSRGYGGVYVKGATSVRISCAEGVDRFKITVNGQDSGTSYYVADLNPVPMNGYNVVDITHLVDAGEINVRWDGYGETEKFYVVDPFGYLVDADKVDDNIVITWNKPAKWVNVMYYIENGNYSGKFANMNFPVTPEERTLTIPNRITLDDGSTAALYDMPDIYWNYINVVFPTGYDTNTFAVDAEGDVFI